PEKERLLLVLHLALVEDIRLSSGHEIRQAFDRITRLGRLRDIGPAERLLHEPPRMVPWLVRARVGQLAQPVRDNAEWDIAAPLEAIRAEHPRIRRKL